jgi:hypothetical protein
MPLQQLARMLVLVGVLFTVQQCSAGSTKAGADDTNPHVWRPRTKSVAVFKNGFGFFIRQGPVECRDGWAVAKEIPPAKFGTLAVYSANADELVDVVGSGPGEIIEFDGVDASKDIAEKRARLESSLKLNVQLTYKHQDADRSAAGKLVSVGPDFAVLESAGNSFAVPVDDITKMQVLDLPLRIHVASDSGKSPAATEIGMAYLREGITWIPEYSLRVLDDTSAELVLRGTLVNEAEDIVHCDVNFVVGVPHFAHMQYMEPIAVGQIIRTIGAAVAPREIQSQMMNRAAIANNTAMSSQFGQEASGSGVVVDQPAQQDGGKLSAAIGNLPQLEAAGATDYTVYTKKDLTVRRGERAIVTLFVKKISYTHIYRWSPPEIMQHFLVLHNDTDSAWTTGPCLAVSGDQPLSEDLLKYTPKAGRCEIPMTASVNIAHEKNETESQRATKASNPSTDKFYDLVTLEGELKLKNFEKRNVEIAIANHVPGKPISASDGGVLASDSTKLLLLEREGTVRWNVTLKPGETKTIQYKYERYVPSG